MDSSDNKVYALNATTGATVWTYGTGNSVESSPAVANGVVYVGSDDNSVYVFGSIAVPQPSPKVPELGYCAVLVLMIFVTFALCWIQKKGRGNLVKHVNISQPLQKLDSIIFISVNWE